jgi:hypothetical protein
VKETALYAPVARYIEQRFNCLKEYTWMAGCGRDLSFKAGFGNRKPDVVACGGDHSNPILHLAEGKLLNLPTHAFEETLNQLDSFRQYADHLWAVFPKTHWASASNNHDRWERELRTRGYGLLLVEDKKVESAFDSQKNLHCDSERRTELANKVLGEDNMRIPLQSLASKAMIDASRAAARVTELMAGPVRRAVGGNRRESSVTIPDIVESRHAFFTIGSVDVGKHAYIQGDPFGRLLGDGCARIWLWRPLGNLREQESAIQNAMEKPHPLDTYFFADSEHEWRWVCRPVSEASISELRAGGFWGEFSIGRGLSVADRTNAGFEKDIGRLVVWSRTGI